MLFFLSTHLKLKVRFCSHPSTRHCSNSLLAWSLLNCTGRWPLGETDSVPAYFGGILHMNYASGSSPTFHGLRWTKWLGQSKTLTWLWLFDLSLVEKQHVLCKVQDSLPLILRYKMCWHFCYENVAIFPNGLTLVMNVCDLLNCNTPYSLSERSWSTTYPPKNSGY